MYITDTKIVLPFVSDETNRTYVFLNEDEQEYFEERAAILEFEAGLERARAEEEAWRLMMQRRAVYTMTG
ncbi:MAG TPA: hypothetical protein ENK44_07030 [Caldithrix abyssi]|uniref:Uncharacterized protein n=1 Tax=Caldithrix abyssi TaxID=187145 RepID=A0A7V4U1Z9_CALAY|nr:hypothetical protein [Caldithrix abyssi]